MPDLRPELRTSAHRRAPQKLRFYGDPVIKMNPGRRSPPGPRVRRTEPLARRFGGAPLGRG